MNHLRFTLIVIFSLVTRIMVAGEGMWIPMLLEQLNQEEMQNMGMKISAEDIYSINHASMKDAVVLFGRGCTAEIISGQGLLLTNHHCGYGSIQRHSSLANDYLTDGFWAMSNEEELPNPGLTVTMMKEMREVTDDVLNGVSTGMSMTERNALINENTKAIVKHFEDHSDYKAYIKPFFQGNKYFMIIVEVFKDIRLVGAPPSNIGRFGGDTDNWMWPRHTGDFSIFRIYVGPDGKPAEYAEENVPYVPDYFFPISLDGVEEDDFTLVFGYPARTSEYLPSYAIDFVANVQNPQVINLRSQRLEIFTKYSEKDPSVRIKYATKHVRVSNKWKKMIGESKGIHRMDGVGQKKAFEEKFSQWVADDPVLVEKYGELIPAFEKVYKEYVPLMEAYNYYKEGGGAIELIGFAARFDKLIKLSNNKSSSSEVIEKETEKLKKQAAGFFKDYYKPIDMEVMAAMLETYDQRCNNAFKPVFFNTIHTKFNGNYSAFTDNVFDKSFLDDRKSVDDFLAGYNTKQAKKLEKDPAWVMFTDLKTINKKLAPKLKVLNNRLDSLMRVYMAARMEMMPRYRFYPDANFTLRVSYGKVKGYQPEDAVNYSYYTTLKGIMEKEDPAVYDYVVEDKLKQLYDEKDYGRYAASDGTMRVAFIATNHTTGGNSGSPVLNAEGQLVGVNFDRVWEGTMSDLMFDSEVCRNISLDIRYFLFIVDKYAGAGYLVDEMEIVN